MGVTVTRLSHIVWQSMTVSVRWYNSPGAFKWKCHATLFSVFQDDYRLPQSQRKKRAQVCPHTFDQLCVYVGSCDCGGGNRRSQRESDCCFNIESTRFSTLVILLLSPQIEVISCFWFGLFRCVRLRSQLIIVKWLFIGAVTRFLFPVGFMCRCLRTCGVRQWSAEFSRWRSSAAERSESQRLQRNKHKEAFWFYSCWSCWTTTDTRCRFVWWGTSMNNQSKVFLISSETLWMRF